MATEPLTPAPTPTPADFRLLREALVAQLPQLADSWWRRVREATKRASNDELLLLRAEAENRLQHEDRRRQRAVLDLLFRVIGFFIGENADANAGDDADAGE
ncbi:MAG: hypothetical protein AB7K09_17940 [Planctomycetota bacterium]